MAHAVRLHVLEDKPLLERFADLAQRPRVRPTVQRPEQARDELSVAIKLYRTMEMTFWLDRAEMALVQGREREK